MTFGKKWFSFFWKFFVVALIVSATCKLIGFPLDQTSLKATVPGWVRESFEVAFWFSLILAAVGEMLTFAQAIIDEIVERVIEGVMERLNQRDQANSELRDILGE